MAAPRPAPPPSVAALLKSCCVRCLRQMRLLTRSTWKQQESRAAAAAAAASAAAAVEVAVAVAIKC